MPICTETISSCVRKVLNIAKAHMSLGTLQGGMALVAGIFLAFMAF